MSTTVIPSVNISTTSSSTSNVISNTSNTNTIGTKVLVIDNGAHTLKCAYASNDSNIQPIVIPNQVGKSKKEKKYIVGDDLSMFHDSSEIRLRNPMEKGYICNWTTEKEIWDHMFKRDDLKVKPSETSLLLTEAPFAMDEIRNALYETVYEQYKFKSLCLVPSTTLGLMSYKNEQQGQSSTFNLSPCHVVVDCGYSSTHVVPHFNGNKLNYAIKRFNVGGKILTNYLKEIVSFRYWDMMHETRLINTIKERVCYVSPSFLSDLRNCQDPSSNIRVDYVLPNYTNNNNTGYIKNKPYYPENIINPQYFVKPGSKKDNMQLDSEGVTATSSTSSSSTTTTEDDVEPPVPVAKVVEQQQDEEDEQTLNLYNERMTIPELLFNPSDIGIGQAGIAESIVQSINCTNVNMHQPLYSNILLIGGSTKFPGFKDRLLHDLRKLAPENLNVQIWSPEEPTLAPIYGGIKMGLQQDFMRLSVSKADYEEHGYTLCNRRFI